jgi:ribosomal protein L35AE/L33A
MQGLYRPKTYIIKLKGRLDENWSAAFAGMTISYENDSTVLKGEITDNSSLQGIITRIHDLNLTIISLEHIQTGNTEKKP